MRFKFSHYLLLIIPASHFYLCYKELCRMELEVSNPRYFMDRMYIKWPKPKDIKQLPVDNWEIQMSLKVDPNFWGPRKIRRIGLEWDERKGQFTEVS